MYQYDIAIICRLYYMDHYYRLLQITEILFKISHFLIHKKEKKQINMTKMNFNFFEWTIPLNHLTCCIVQYIAFGKYIYVQLTQNHKHLFSTGSTLLNTSLSFYALNTHVCARVVTKPLGDRGEM